MSQEEDLIPRPTTPPPERPDALLATPEQQGGEEVFRRMRERLGTQRELQQLLDLLHQYITPLLTGPKRQDIEDFLREPEVLISNPSQYRKFFELMDQRLSDETVGDIKGLSRTIAKQYREYLRTKSDSVAEEYGKKDADKAKEDTDIKQERNIITQERNIITQEIDTKKQEIDTKKQEIDTKKQEIDTKKQEVTAKATSEKAEIKKQEENIILDSRDTINNARQVIPQAWNTKLDAYVTTRLQDEERFRIAKERNSALQLSTPEERALYLQAEFLLTHQHEIRSELQKSIASAPADKREELTKQLSVFDKTISTLEGMDITRPVIGLAKEIRSFPPTVATETAFALGERYEKTHTVYRDGTSLYFVDKANPEDTKKIEIYGDRAVLTVSRGGLSIARDMPPLSREEASDRREKRKLDDKNTSLKQEVSKDAQGITLIQEYDIPTDMREGKKDTISRYTQAQKKYREAQSPEETLSALRELRRENENLEQSRRKSITLSNTTDPLMTGLEDKLWNELRGLSTLETSLSRYIESTKESQELTKKLPPSRAIPWEKTAREVLSTITSDTYGYGELGQENFEKLMNGLKRQNPSGLWRAGFILDNPVLLRKQVLELRDISKQKTQEYAPTGEPKVAWKNIRKELSQDGTALQKTWKSQNPSAIGEWAHQGKSPAEKPKSAT